MDFAKIKKFIQARDYFFSEHADEERTKDELTTDEVEEAIVKGRIIEERLDDPRGESHLVVGESNHGRLLHIVIGTRFKKPVIVTVYTPENKKWIYGRIRRR